MNLCPRKVEPGIAFALAVLVLCVFSFTKFDLVQNIQKASSSVYPSEILYDDLDAEQRAADPSESSERFDEYEALYANNLLSITPYLASTYNLSRFKSKYKKRLAFCFVRGPPAAKFYV